MNSLRIGCDRTIIWSITSGGEPYDLSGKNIRLKVSTRSTQFYVSTDDFSIDGNKIIWLFRGKDQKHLGPYTLTYIENEGMDDMLTFDRCNAFNFVACSCHESRSSSKDMEISNIDLSSEIKALGVKLWPNLIPLTYQELFSLRASSGLLPGAFYRITDYVTTTSQEKTQSAGHQFDVIVLALTNDTLAERAWACHHEGDTYFQNSHLEAWQIWYCLDNDSDRFEWSVPASDGGKGVIYRMIDEFNNDCPYDFKNIQFIINGRAEYTFYNAEDLDGSSYSNTVKPFSETRGAQELNRIIFNSNCWGNSFGNDCKDNQLGIFCCNNRFGNNCTGNRFGNNCTGNSFGNDCHNNSLPNFCTFNNFGNSCARISLIGYLAGSVAPYARFNTFGDGCSVTLKNNATASSERQIQNYRIAKGTTGIVEVIRGLAYETTIAVDSAGNVKQFCIADIIL